MDAMGGQAANVGLPDCIVQRAQWLAVKQIAMTMQENYVEKDCPSMTARMQPR